MSNRNISADFPYLSHFVEVHDALPRYIDEASGDPIVFLHGILPQMTVRKLSAEERKSYLEFFPTIAIRKPVRQWPGEIPADGMPADLHELVSAFSRKLRSSEAPKQLLSPILAR